MRQGSRFGRAAAVIALVIISGCATGPTRTEVAQLAEAGKAANKALSQVASSTSSAMADASAERLLSQRQLPQARRIEAVKQERKTLDDYSNELNRVSESAVLMSRYYASLADLANSTAPMDVKGQVEALNKEFDRVNTLLAITPPPAMGALPQLANFALNKKIENDLREELQQRGPNLLEIQKKQDAILDEIATALTSNVGPGNNEAGNRIVFDPYVNGEIKGLDAEKDWKEAYMNFYERPSILAGVKKAQLASHEMTIALESVLSGEPTAERLNNAISQFRDAINILNTARGVP